jgi:Tol biopolymer transport system component
MWPSASAAAHAVTTRASESTAGVQADGPSGRGGVAISANGRLVAFVSTASNLVAGDTNGVADVFVRDLRTNVTRRVSVATSGAQADGGSSAGALAISPDGRFVAFTSVATNLSAANNDSLCGGGPCPDVYLRDRLAGTTRLLLPFGTEGTPDHLVLSASAGFFAFTNLNVQRVFRCRRSTRRCRVASVPPAGFRNDSTDSRLSLGGMSRNGRLVLFRASGIDSAPHPPKPLALGIFLRDMRARTTRRVTDRAGDIPGGLSPQGRFVLFSSRSAQLVAHDTNGRRDVFIRDLVAGSTHRISVSSTGAQANRGSLGVGISSGGRVCMFTSAATNLVGNDRNGLRDLFVRDRVVHRTSRVDVSTAGAESNGALAAWALAGNGRWVAFDASATDLVPADTNAFADVFARGPLP